MHRALLPLLALAIAPIGDFEFFYGNFSRAVVRGEAAHVAALTRTPFLFEGKKLDSQAFQAAVPRLFDAPMRDCLRSAKVVTAGARRQIACHGSRLVFEEVSRGDWRFTRFESADGVGRKPR